MEVIIRATTKSQQHTTSTKIHALHQQHSNITTHQLMTSWKAKVGALVENHA